MVDDDDDDGWTPIGFTPKPDRTTRNARWLKRLHGWLAIVWGVMIPVSVLTGLRSSVPYLVLLSVYALMVGHFASWQGSRAEVANGDSEKEDA